MSRHRHRHTARRSYIGRPVINHIACHCCLLWCILGSLNDEIIYGLPGNKMLQVAINLENTKHVDNFPLMCVCVWGRGEVYFVSLCMCVCVCEQCPETAGVTSTLSTLCLTGYFFVLFLFPVRILSAIKIPFAIYLDCPFAFAFKSCTVVVVVALQCGIHCVCSTTSHLPHPYCY